MPEGGTYTLVIRLVRPAPIRFGAAGVRDLPAGWLAYTGSARGPGGFARVDRHRALARGEREVRHWHVDALLCAPGSHIERVVRSPGLDAECAVASAVTSTPGVDPVPGVGATDCGCDAHLAGPSSRARLDGAVAAAHDAVRGSGPAGPSLTHD